MSYKSLIDDVTEQTLAQDKDSFDREDDGKPDKENDVDDHTTFRGN